MLASCDDSWSSAVTVATATQNVLIGWLSRFSSRKEGVAAANSHDEQ